MLRKERVAAGQSAARLGSNSQADMSGEGANKQLVPPRTSDKRKEGAREHWPISTLGLGRVSIESRQFHFPFKLLPRAAHSTSQLFNHGREISSQFLIARTAFRFSLCFDVVDRAHRRRKWPPQTGEAEVNKAHSA